MVEGKIVAEQDETIFRVLDGCHQGGEAVDVLAVDLNQLQRAGIVGCGHVDGGMDGLHQG